MLYGVSYNVAQNRALNAFIDLSRNDLYVLDTLHYNKSPVSYCGIKLLIKNRYHLTLSEQRFCDSLKRLQDSRFVSKINTGYHITAQGIQLLHQYNIVLDQIVKELICDYADRHGL